MQVKSHGISISNSNDFNRCNSNNNNSYNSQLVNSFLNKSSPTRSNPPSLDIVGKVRSRLIVFFFAVALSPVFMCIAVVRSGDYSEST